MFFADPRFHDVSGVGNTGTEPLKHPKRPRSERKAGYGQATPPSTLDPPTFPGTLSPAG